VIGVAHPKWEERPLLILELHEGSSLNREAVLAYQTERVVKWWLPDDVIFAAVPLTAISKIDKKVLRGAYRGHLLDA